MLDSLDHADTNPGKVISLNGAAFQMTEVEWSQVKRWIKERKQEAAMRWWASEFSIPFERAVGVINRVQIGIEYGHLT
jgi:hypothetical protein